jgi:hypothetical protein
MLSPVSQAGLPPVSRRLAIGFKPPASSRELPTDLEPKIFGHNLSDLASFRELATRVQQLALRLRSLRPSNRAKAVGGALKLAGMPRSAVEVARVHRSDMKN